jgi:hypothetical protein
MRPQFPPRLGQACAAAALSIRASTKSYILTRLVMRLQPPNAETWLAASNYSASLRCSRPLTEDGPGFNISFFRYLKSHIASVVVNYAEPHAGIRVLNIC